MISRLYLYAAAGIALALIGWRVMVWREGYQERDAAVAAAEVAQDALEADRNKWAAEVARATVQAAADAETARQVQADSARIQFERDQLLGRVAELNARGALTVEEPSDEPNECPVVHLGPDVRVQFNAAVSAGDPAQ